MINRPRSWPRTLRILVEPQYGHRNRFVPHVGYENASALAKEAYTTGRAIKEIILEKGLLTEAEMNHILSPAEMTKPGIAGADILKVKGN